jgi:hypothetical protein
VFILAAAAELVVVVVARRHDNLKPFRPVCVCVCVCACVCVRVLFVSGVHVTLMYGQLVTSSTLVESCLLLSVPFAVGQ